MQVAYIYIFGTLRGFSTLKQGENNFSKKIKKNLLISFGFFFFFNLAVHVEQCSVCSSAAGQRSSNLKICHYLAV